MSAPASAPPTTRSYFPELDGVRAVAIALVMLFHMRQQGIPVPGPMMLGQTGVDLFFVLSGFLITSILLKAAPQDWHEVRTFYIRRALRIFPLYYAYLIGAALLHHPAPIVFWVYLQNVVLALNPRTPGPNHFWSLAVEEHFYLVWPFVALFLPRRHLLGVLWTAIVGALLCRAILVHLPVESFYLTPARVDALSAGAILAVVQSRGSLEKLRRSVFLPICLVSGALLAYQGTHTGVAWIQVTKFTAISAFYTALLGIVLTSGRNPLNRVLGSAALRFVGRISYGLYVFHPAIFEWVAEHLHRNSLLLRAIVEVLATFAVALISWYGMERHCIALKDRLAPERARFPRRAPSLSAL